MKAGNIRKDGQKIQEILLDVNLFYLAFFQDGSEGCEG
jgi:hypothetical protein